MPTLRSHWSRLSPAFELVFLIDPSHGPVADPN